MNDDDEGVPRSFFPLHSVLTHTRYAMRREGGADSSLEVEQLRLACSVCLERRTFAAKMERDFFRILREGRTTSGEEPSSLLRRPLLGRRNVSFFVSSREEV